MNLDKKQTDKGCIEYVDPDMRCVSVPVRVPPNMVMYRVCGNGCCMNPEHMYYLDGDAAHQLEMGLRDVTLAYLRKYFGVDPVNLYPLEPKQPPNIQSVEGQQARIWLPPNR
jgi:hypothetical protein